MRFPRYIESLFHFPLLGLAEFSVAKLLLNIEVKLW